MMRAVLINTFCVVQEDPVRAQGASMECFSVADIGREFSTTGHSGYNLPSNKLESMRGLA
jgi:hypothetical protein